MTSKTDRTQELLDTLAGEVAELASGDDWKRALDVATRFHHYSFRNVMLIAIQRPDATQVAGYRTWQSLGRQVRRGERGIAILAPSTRTIEVENADGEIQKVRRVVGFHTVHVFDVAQTDGDELPTLPMPELLAGEAPAGMIDAVADLAGEIGFTVERGDCGRANGWCDHGRQVIRIRDDVDDAQAAKTLVHEVAHALLHGPDDDTASQIREVEAESVAYVVCNAAGVPTSDYSIPYVAGWSGGDASAVSTAGERIVRTARRILEALEAAGTQAQAVAA